jgi:hypothetical protein
MRSSEGAWRAPVGILVALGLLASAQAQEVELVQRNALGRGVSQGRENTTRLDVRAGLTASDNIMETAGQETSDIIATIGTNIDLARQGSRLDYDLLGNLDWAHYLRNTYRGTLLGSFNGQASFQIVPGHVAWAAEESVAQLVENPTAANTPDNLQTVSYFTTGPRFDFHLGSATVLQLNGDYSKVSSATSLPGQQNVASTRYSGGASLVRHLSTGSSLSLTGTTQAVYFDDTTVNQNYHQNSAFLGYRLSSSRTQLALSFGGTQLRLPDGNRTGMTVGLDLARRITASSTVLLHLSQQTADSADLLRMDLSSRLGVLSGLQVTQSTPVEERGAQASWLFARERNSMSVSFDWTHDVGKVDHAFDRSYEVGRVQYSRRIRPVLTLNLSTQYIRQELSELNFNYNEFDATAALAWQLEQRINLSFQYDHMRRTAAGGGVGSFTENRIGLIATYRVLGPGS